MPDRYGSFCKTLAAAFVLAVALSGCDKDVTIEGVEGQKLGELDMSGDPPDKLVLAGPDHVRISEGPHLSIAIDGDPQIAEHLRFTLKDGTLGVLRTKALRDGGAVNVNVTMPAPKELTLSGSGSIDSPAMGKGGKITLAGSGDIRAGTISGSSLAVSVAGSGSLKGGGAVTELDMTIAGSGNADLAALRTDRAKVTIAGSGSATMASDGEVAATIVGSGTVRVKGRATCTVSAVGSGKLLCESGPPRRANPD